MFKIMQGVKRIRFSRSLGCLLAFVLSATLVGAMGSSVYAQVLVDIDRSSQTMTVTVDGQSYAVWKISTARKGYVTPPGVYRPKRMERVWYSRKYDNAPMPYSIFFRGGYAIHGTTEVRNLGRPVSHGCVRLHPDHARDLYRLVRERGMSNTMIRVTERRATSILSA